MKNLLYLLTIPTLFFISSCSDETAPGDYPEKKDGPIAEDSVLTDEETKFDPKKYREFDMAAFELNVVIMIPKTYHKEDDEDGTPVDRFDQPDIVHNDGEAKWEIRMPGHKDRYWHMEIDDWGGKVQTIEMLKKEHESQKNIFDFIYFEEGDGYVRYSKVLQSDNTTISEADVKSMPNHHFYCIKNIGGSYMVFQSYRMDDFRELSVKEMLVAARETK